MMNREQRRAYDKKIKHDKLAVICPICKHKARMYTAALNPTDIYLECERCNSVVCSDKEAHKYIPAGIYCNPIIYEAVIKAGKAKEKENEKVE